MSGQTIDQKPQAPTGGAAPQAAPAGDAPPPLPSKSITEMTTGASGKGGDAPKGKALARIKPKKVVATKSNTRASQRQMRYLAQSVVLEEAGTSRLVRLAIFTVSIVVLSFVVWSIFTKIDEVAITKGEILPSGSVRIVQHLEGGIIQSIDVKEGDMVQPGQVLATLDPTATMAEYEQMRAREAGLMLRAERLRAFAENRSPNFGNIPPEFMHLLKDQEQILVQSRDSQASKNAVLLDQIAQRKEELRALNEQYRSVNSQLALVSEQVAMREELMQKGLTSRITYLETKREYSRLLGEKNKFLKQIQVARDAIAEADNRLTETDEGAKDTALKEMGTVTAELAQVREQLKRLQNRMSRLKITAGVAGHVQNLRYRTIGGVIPAGGTLLEIVPYDEQLWVETRISTGDIGFVSVGQPAKVKVTTFDYARFGFIPGTLDSISASTFLDEAGQPYYKGIVKLERNFVGQRNDMQVMPGMVVQADIVTGEKTVFQYLLKPVYVGMQASFRER